MCFVWLLQSWWSSTAQTHSLERYRVVVTSPATAKDIAWHLILKWRLKCGNHSVNRGAHILVVHFWCGTYVRTYDRKAQRQKFLRLFCKEKAQKNALRLLVAPFLLPPTIKKTTLRLSQPVYSIKHEWACPDFSFDRLGLYTFLTSLRSNYSPSRPLQLCFVPACETSFAHDIYAMQSTPKKP